MNPRACRSLAIEDDTIPFPRPDMMDPVITMNLVFFSGIGRMWRAHFLNLTRIS